MGCPTCQRKTPFACLSLCFQNTIVHNNNQADRLIKVEHILAQLEAVSTERAGIVSNYEHINCNLPSTDILAFDALLSYMQRKAGTKNVSLELSFDTTVNELIPNHISQEDASPLLADLLENAIIAAGENSRNKSVYVEFVRDGVSPCIRISDTGGPFPDKVKKNWGIRRVTTRAANGGSGIGMMTIFEICKRYHASFLVEDLGSEPIYTKRVSVRFDGAWQCSFGDNT